MKGGSGAQKQAAEEIGVTRRQVRRLLVKVRSNLRERHEITVFPGARQAWKEDTIWFRCAD